jgi:hypothetical protein
VQNDLVGSVFTLIELLQDGDQFQVQSSPVNRNIKLVTSDVKMQIRILHVVCEQSLDMPKPQ